MRPAVWLMPRDANYRFSESIKAHRRNWALTPLRGKVPFNSGWQNAPMPTEEQVTRWAKAGNIGLRTGIISGVIVIDVDSNKGGSVDSLELPRTVTVITGSGGQHLYFGHPGRRTPNSVGRIAPHVDVRADSGQVVFPGSVHPDTGRVYVWADGLSPDDLPLADLPEAILRLLVEPPSRNSANTANIAKRVSFSQLGDSSRSRYGRVALDREAHATKLAPEGSRNSRLNLAAFRLGRLVSEGHISEQEVGLRLEWAAASGGLSTREALRTIRSGLTAGMRKARR